MKCLGRVVCQLVENRAVVVIPENDPLLGCEAFVHSVFDPSVVLKSTLLNADRVDISKPGVHIVGSHGRVDDSHVFKLWTVPAWSSLRSCDAFGK